MSYSNFLIEMGQSYDDFAKIALKVLILFQFLMLSVFSHIFWAPLFQKYALFCVLHPLEVMFLTLVVTVSSLFLSFYAVQYRIVCGWNYVCESDVNDNAFADILIFTVVKCLAVFSIYFQFKKLQTLGSKYFLGFAVLFIIFSSFVFGTTLIIFFVKDLTGINEAVPFFVVLIDLNICNILGKYALGSKDIDQIKKNTAEGIAKIGPQLTLDTLEKMLFIGLGTLSGIRTLEVGCCFGVLALFSNYIVFMTFYPACLCLMLEMSLSKEKECKKCVLPVWHLLREDVDVKCKQMKNPVVLRIKVIMMFASLLLYLYSSILTQLSSFFPFVYENDIMATSQSIKQVMPSQSLFTFYIIKIFTFNIEDWVVFCLAFALSLHYIFSKKIVDTSESLSLTKEEDKGENNKEDNVIASEIENLSDEELVKLVKKKKIAAYQLETILKDFNRAIKIRRLTLLPHQPHFLPYENFSDWSIVNGVCCENVIGYVPIPVGVVGPLLVNGKQFYVPMATTEGCLIASTNRGARAISLSSSKVGVSSYVYDDGMTRSPVLEMDSISAAVKLKEWLHDHKNYKNLKYYFESTSRFCKLESIKANISGRLIFLRFKASTGDAMGMNMVSKACKAALKYTCENFSESIKVLSISGNFCCDKKASNVNTILGRGKSVVCEAQIEREIVKSVLKTNSSLLCSVNTSKNLIGSSLAGTVGGNNAHAANIVAAIFLATGQDTAQVVTSSSCSTQVECCGDGDLRISCTMPCLEVATVGGGTRLSAQSSCLSLLGIQGSSKISPGDNSRELAKIIASTVLAGELSLLSALSSGHLVESHMKYNRSATQT